MSITKETRKDFVDWTIKTKEGYIMVEFQKNKFLDKRNSMIQEYMRNAAFIYNEIQKQDKLKVVGNYRVKETFAGNESLTDLLTKYIERTVSLKY